MKNLSHKTISSITISIILGFFVIVIFLVIILTQKGNNIQETNVIPYKSSDRLIKFTTLEETQKTTQVKKEGYLSDIEKPFAEGNYDYDERTKDFRLVCENPCPVSKEVLDQEFAAIAHSVSTLRGLTQSDFEGNILPFEVHASDDGICDASPKEYLAYMTTLNNRGLLCFFFEKINYNRDKFPYSTSVHEVTHLMESGKVEHNSVIWEGLSEMMESFFLRGNERNSFCWQGNAWYKNAMQNSHDPHWVGGDLFFELCNQYGFDYDDLPSLFVEADRKGSLTTTEFVQTINSIVGADTSYLFRNAGLNV